MKKKLLTLVAMTLVVTSSVQALGEGPAGVFLQVNATTNVAFNLNGINWGASNETFPLTQNFNSHDFGTPTTLIFSWARGRAWSGGDPCTELWHRFAVFYRITNTANPETEWSRIAMNHCERVGSTDNAWTRTQTAWTGTDILQMAYNLDGPGEYNLQMAVVWQAQVSNVETPPTGRIHTATFRVFDPTITLAADSASILEGNSMRVVASVPFAHPTTAITVTLDFEGTDFTGSPTITIPAGQTSAYTTLTAYDDRTKNEFPQRSVNIGMLSATGPSGVTFTLSEEVQVFIRDIDYGCPPPTAPAISIGNVCRNATEVIFEITNLADYVDPIFTLWTTATGGTELTTEFDATTRTITPAEPFSANASFFLQVRVPSLSLGCDVSARTPINVVVVEAPSDFDTLITPTNIGENTGRILFTAGSLGVGPFDITLFDAGNVEIGTETGVVTSVEFSNLYAGVYRAVITATGNPAGCQIYEVTNIEVALSDCAEIPAQPQLTVGTTCYGFGTTLTITNWSDGITYRLYNSAHIAQTGIEQDDNVLTIPNHLAVGAFTLVAIDMSLPDGCRVSPPIHALTVNAVPTGATAEMTQQSSPFIPYGIITVTAGNNGALPFSVVLKNDEGVQVGTTQTIAAHLGTTQFIEVPAGDFTVEVADNNGCMQTPFGVTVTECTPPPTPIVPNDVRTCVGSTATITITNFDNTLFTYSLHSTDADGGELIQHITSATFETPVISQTTILGVIRTIIGGTVSESGCEWSVTVFPVRTTPLPVFTAIPTHTHCATGSIAVTVTSGNAPFTVTVGDSTINNVALNSEILITGLAPQTYAISVTSTFGCVSSENVEIERLPCTSPSNENAVSHSNSSLGFVALNESLTITLDPSLLSLCACLTSGENLYIRLFYRYRRDPGVYQTISFTDWGIPAMIDRFRMDFENGVYTFYIQNIRELIETGTSDGGLGAFAPWMADRPMGLGFHFFHSDGNGGFSVIRAEEGLTTGGDFWIDLTQDFALSLWIAGGVVNYYVGESIPFEYEKHLRFDNVWYRDTVNDKRYPIELLRDGNIITTIPANVNFVGGRYYRAHELNTNGTFVFTARAVSPGGYRMASNPWAPENSLVSHNVTVHNPVVTLTTDSASIFEGNSKRVVATVPFAHPTAELTVTLDFESTDFTGNTTIIIPAGQTSAYVTLTAVENLETRTATIDVTSITGLTGVNFTLYEILNVAIISDASCLPPPTPIVESAVYVSFNATTATFTITNYNEAFIYRVYRDASGEDLMIEFAAGTGATKTLSDLNPIRGDSVFYLKAVDLSGMVECQNSQLATININALAAPAVISLAPATGTEIYVGDTITFTATGNATTAAKRLYIDGTAVHPVSTNTLSFVWIATTAGNHTFHVVALNDVGYSYTSAERTFTVNEQPPTSIFETDDARLLVYPNPVRDILYIENPSGEPLTVEIYTLSGVRVAIFLNVENTIDVSHLPSGTYLLRIGTRVVRIVKQ
ncbi:MAG: T9SS type A sorting domain-containing protein [Bacteroidales bacterium]|nr:T9SS type A sorting domain-containing protein [Bacteroidales bacterium]